MIPDYIAGKLSAFETKVNSMLTATVSYATLWAVAATTTLSADEPCVVPAEEIESLTKLGVVEFFDRLRHPMLEAVPVNNLREERGQLTELSEPMPARTRPAIHPTVSNEIFAFHSCTLVCTNIL